MNTTKDNVQQAATTGEPQFEPTTHLEGGTSDAHIALFMGGEFHNSACSNLPTRVQRVYFAPFDEFELVHPAVTVHDANLSIFNNPAASSSSHSWDRHCSQKLCGYRIKDVQSFSWRAHCHGYNIEIKATRRNDVWWQVEYFDDHVPTEDEVIRVNGSQILRSWLQMIDPNTLKFTKTPPDITRLSAVALRAVFIDNDGTTSGNHVQLYQACLEYYQSRHEVVIKGRMPVSFSRPSTAYIEPWWHMMMALPSSDELPAVNDGFAAVHAWNLKHVDILYKKHGEKFLYELLYCDRTVTEEQMVEEMVIIGSAMYQILDYPPTFSFALCLRNLRWESEDYDEEECINRVLTEASRRLGWTMQ